MKVLQSGFYWPSLFKDHMQGVRQMPKIEENLSSSHDASKPILVVDLFNV